MWLAETETFATPVVAIVVKICCHAGLHRGPVGNRTMAVSSQMKPSALDHRGRLLQDQDTAGFAVHHVTSLQP